MKSKNIIKVCQGPGCRAWGSTSLIQKIKAWSQETQDKPKVCSATCMNRCGGGASVEVVARHSFVKIKNSPEQLQSQLCTQPVMS
jgi:NADH:ubiquinone oxidoreductase subunit E